MAFASIFIPNFMLQAVVRSEPALRGRPVAIIEGAAPVWSVVAFNEAASNAGIVLGMTKSQVQQFLGIEIRHRSPAQEKAAHAALLDLGWSLSPRVEDTSPDTVVLDLAGLNSLLGSDEKIVKQLAEDASNLGLLAHIAVAPKIETAIVAARGFPGITLIPEGAEAEILGQLPVSALSPSLETLETLDRWGVRTCASLVALPVLQLSERLGQEGVRLHELAQGQSDRAMVLAEPALHFEEEMELEDAVEELEPLSFLLARLLGQLCARLDARSLAVCAVRVRFELDPAFEPDSARQRFNGGAQYSPASARGPVTPNPAALFANGGEGSAVALTPENGGSQNIHPGGTVHKSYERVLSLPAPMRDAKTLLNLLRLHLQADPPNAPILKITLTADAARPRVAQGGLFLPGSPDPEKLELTLARLAHVVGDANVGSPALLDTHRPEEFRMRRFVPLGNETQSRRQNRNGNGASGVSCHISRVAEGAKTSAQTPARASLTGFRVFRPALPAKVELREGCPVQVRFQGINGRVVAASGPWRSSGDWWREDGWQNDEWDLEIVSPSTPEARTRLASDFEVLGSADKATNSVAKNTVQRGFYRIFFDAIRKEWFVRGAYD